MNGWAVFLILVFVVVVCVLLGFVIQRTLRARRLGLPAPSLNPFASRRRGRDDAYTPPAPAPGGIGGWLKDKFSGFRSDRSSAGAYEATTFQGSGGRRRGGFDPLDPDEAWDSRVGNEADYGGGGPGYAGYEEAALRDADAGPYGGGGYDDGRGRHTQRELDQRYDEEMGRASTEENPFGDNAQKSDLRGVSPRPIDGHDRRSAFREDM